MKLLTIAAASALMMLGTAAQAQSASPLYGEIGISRLTVKGDEGFKVNPTALRGIVGYNVHPLVAVEGMLAFGLSDDEHTFDFGAGPETESLKLRHAYGVFVKPKFSPTNNFEVFGRLGWAKAKFKAEGAGFSETVSDSGAAYGLGVNYSFNPKMYVGVDYMRYAKVEGAKVNSLSVSFGYRF
jgi:outer membrane autotransporter protein